MPTGPAAPSGTISGPVGQAWLTPHAPDFNDQLKRNLEELIARNNELVEAREPPQKPEFPGLPGVGDTLGPLGREVVLMAAFAPGGVVETLAGGAYRSFRGAQVAEELAPAADVGSEFFYRAMSSTHAEELLATGRLSATAETFISPTKAFAQNYEGVLVRFRLQAGTTAQLAEVGVRDASRLVAGTYPEMAQVSRGWSATNAFFKAEGAQINIGLGRGAALDVFNSNMKGYNVIGF